MSAKARAPRRLRDDAVTRRFDATIAVPAASREALLEIARLILRGRFGLEPESVLELAGTPAAVTQVAQNMLRRKVIEAARASKAETVPLFSAMPSTPETKKAAMEECVSSMARKASFVSSPKGSRRPAAEASP